MTEDFSIRVARIEALAKVLARRAEALNNRRLDAAARIARLEDVAARRQSRIARLESEAQYLTAALTLTPSRQEVDSTRATIARLVRDIDKCILELTDSPVAPATEMQ